VGFQPEASRDKSLTAFAQLAAFRLDVRRCMISLIDSNRQYILAEATKTVSLFQAQAERPEDEVWLGNAVLNKTDAVCYHTFSSTYTAKEKNGDTLTAECMVVPDCRLDPRFADKDYVVSEPGVRFYAGVPIITKAGHRIGGMSGSRCRGTTILTTMQSMPSPTSDPARGSAPPTCASCRT
jgi:GAF domain-containing protein